MRGDSTPSGSDRDETVVSRIRTPKPDLPPPPVLNGTKDEPVPTIMAVKRDGDSRQRRLTTHLPSPSPTPTELTPPNPNLSPLPNSHPTNGKGVSEPPHTCNMPSATRPETRGKGANPIESPLSSPQPSEQSSQDATENKKERHHRSGVKTGANEGVRRLSASQMQQLTAAPDSLPVASLPRHRLPPFDPPKSAGPFLETANKSSTGHPSERRQTDPPRPDESIPPPSQTWRLDKPLRTLSTPPTSRRPSAVSGQPLEETTNKRRNSSNPTPLPLPLDLEGRSNLPSAATPKMTANASSSRHESAANPRPPSPIPPAVPLPPMSIPTVLQLELAAERPSPLYIHHSYASDLPYESNAVKFERLKNFLLLPSYFERTMTFGAVACLDAWLWTFTILPMRFLSALGVLVQWWGYVIRKETHWLVGFVWGGLGRLWTRKRQRSESSRRDSHSSAASDTTDTSRSRRRSSGAVANGRANPAGAHDARNTYRPGSSRLPNTISTPSNGGVGGSGSGSGGNGGCSASGSNGVPGPKHQPSKPPIIITSNSRHRRTKSMPSNLTSVHKADLLQGLVIVCSSIFLMNLDASRMYHFIRAQSAMKLYVIYNVLEVSDRLLSALGQDVFECLFSSETLSRNSSGRSKVLLPFGMFLLSLAYNTFHSVTLFYQVTTLNVAVNSYSNALLTLLISNQFVEIKSSVFKRFEKENTFQLTCADIVERFQMWIMLFIIGMRNVVEVGGLSVPGAGSEGIGDDTASSPANVPLHSPSVLPASFTIIPSWLFSGEVLSPFLIVIGSEMVVDWIKHAYINKFNNIKPTLYSRILDVLCKDYYTSAFAAPSLTRRLGLPLTPLSCLFIRASVQTYHMFLATHLPAPLHPSTQTSLSVESSATPSTSSPPAVLTALDRFDSTIRSALGRAVHGYPEQFGAGDTPSSASGSSPASSHPLVFWGNWTSDDVIATVTMIVVFLLVFLVLLIFKLILGMILLRYSRDRYARMKAAEHAVATGKAEREIHDARGRRVGGYGQVEVGEDRRRWVYGDDPDGLRKAREKDRRAEQAGDKDKDIGNVMRYEMSARRIW